jgi:Fuc2NAc and GlcNAc transferase
MIKIVSLLSFVFICSVVLTGAMFRYAVNKKLLDIPNKRSLHSVSMPRGGGMAFVVLYSLILIAFTIGTESDLKLILCLLFGGVLVSGVGFWDDHNPLPAQARLIVHVAAALFVVIMIGAPKEIIVNNLSINLGWFGNIFAVLFIVWLINLYNFMDGIDGIASIEALCVTIGVTTVILLSNIDGLNYNLLPTEVKLLIFLLLALALAVAGFLVWNWPPAKIFMGDVGSGYLGFIISVFVIYTHITDMVNIWVWFILLGVFLVDSSSTLVTRMITGQKWYAAHRSHAYQHLAQKWGSHKKVTMSIFAINIIWLLPLAWLAMITPDSGALFTAIAYFPLLIITFVFRAGRA